MRVTCAYQVVGDVRMYDSRQLPATATHACTAEHVSNNPSRPSSANARLGPMALRVTMVLYCIILYCTVLYCIALHLFGQKQPMGCVPRTHNAKL